MRAIIFKEFGGPQVLQVLSDIPMPEPTINQLLVRVKACALNRADILQRKGKYPPPPGESDILGIEISGEVVGILNPSSEFKLGDRVFGLVGSGAYAEYCVIDESCAMHIPDKLSFVEAAAIPEAFLTAHEAVLTLGELKPSDSILIHAGASGVGSAAIQLAALTGATIFSTASSDKKIEKIKSLGSAYLVNYKKDDLFAEIKKLTNNQGVNVIIDFIGASYLANHLELLQPCGRLVIVGLMGGTRSEINLGLIQSKRLQIKGLAMRTRPIQEKRHITQLFKTHYLPFFTEEKLKPVIDSIFSFQDVQLAHQRMEDNANIGKIILSY